MVVLVMGQQQWHMVAMAYETTSPWCSKVQQWYLVQQVYGATMVHGGAMIHDVVQLLGR